MFCNYHDKSVVLRHLFGLEGVARATLWLARATRSCVVSVFISLKVLTIIFLLPDAVLPFLEKTTFFLYPIGVAIVLSPICKSVSTLSGASDCY